MVTLDFVQTAAAAGLVLLLGTLIHRVLPVTARYNLPGPVLGGLAVALVLTALRREDGTLPLVFDTLLQTPLMVAFFTTLGFGASMRVLRSGGPQVLTYLVLCSVLAVLQNVLGAGVATAFGLPPLFGVLAGSVTLTGGPGTGLAFAGAFEEAGVTSAATVAITAAMGGIVLGGLLGGPAGTWLVERHGLRSAASTAGSGPGVGAAAQGHGDLLKHVILLLVAMGVGSVVSATFKSWGVTLPAYIGAMLVAAVLRNVDDRTGWLRLDEPMLDRLGHVSLSLFLALSLMTLKLWELSRVALPLLVMLACQAAFMTVVALTVMFRVSGRDYDAAVMGAGLIGFMMGTTANAMANMDALTRRYGPAPRAYLVIPMVGACFVDFTNAAIITVALNLLRQS